MLCAAGRLDNFPLVNSARHRARCTHETALHVGQTSLVTHLALSLGVPCRGRATAAMGTGEAVAALMSDHGVDHLQTPFYAVDFQA